MAEDYDPIYVYVQTFGDALLHEQTIHRRMYYSKFDLDPGLLRLNYVIDGGRQYIGEGGVDILAGENWTFEIRGPLKDPKSWEKWIIVTDTFTIYYHETYLEVLSDQGYWHLFEGFIDERGLKMMAAIPKL